jgi:DNA polymerase III delta subunit
LGDNQTAQAEAVRAHVKALAGMLAGADCGGNVLVITTPKIDHRSTLFRLCQDRFEVREFMIPEKAHQAERQAREAIQAGLKTYGLRANAEVEELIFGRVGNDSRRIACELEKLAIYMGGRSSVALADVAAVVSASATAVTWDLQDAVGERNLAKAVGIVQDLLVQKESPISIAVAVASRTRELLLYRQAMERGWLRTKAGAYGREYAEWQGFSEDEKPALTLALKRPPESVHAFVAGKLMQQARHYTVTQLARNQRMVLDTQEALVSSSVPHVTAIELMLARTMGITSS